jgi:hypothetical protein
MGLRDATLEDVRTAPENVTHGVGKATKQQYILRAKSLLDYAHKVCNTPFNAGATIKAARMPATAALRSPSASSRRRRWRCRSVRRRDRFHLERVGSGESVVAWSHGPCGTMSMADARAAFLDALGPPSYRIGVAVRTRIDWDHVTDYILRQCALKAKSQSPIYLGVIKETT